jgi:hypothetical protein
LGERARGEGSPPVSPHRNGHQGSCRGELQCSREGTPRPAPRWPKLTLIAGCVLLLAAVAGCGESAGVSEGARVSVYVAAPLCAEAGRELERRGGEAGDVKVRTVCLPSAERPQKLDLARIGANARRATEDATAIGYIGESTRSASRFSEPIIEAAGIAQLTETSGAAAMRKLLRAVEDAGSSGSLRESVNDELG